MTAAGGIEAGLAMARVCLADLASVAIVPPSPGGWSHVRVQTDHPVLACLGSQYAGWEIKGEDFFAMGSGPMRAAAAREPLFADIGYRETADACVGVLEAGEAAAAQRVRELIAAKCGVAPNKLTLLVAPTSSMAGTLQIVARSVETALHKLHELNSISRESSAALAFAPLPPLADNDLAGDRPHERRHPLRRPRDAGRSRRRRLAASKSVRACPATLRRTTAGRSPSCSPRTTTTSTASIRLLFSPAEVTFVNLDTGRSFHFGEPNADVLAKSFGPRRESGSARF